MQIMVRETLVCLTLQESRYNSKKKILTIFDRTGPSLEPKKGILRPETRIRPGILPFLASANAMGAFLPAEIVRAVSGLDQALTRNSSKFVRIGPGESLKNRDSCPESDQALVRIRGGPRLTVQVGYLGLVTRLDWIGKGALVRDPEEPHLQARTRFYRDIRGRISPVRPSGSCSRRFSPRMGSTSKLLQCGENRSS